MHAIIAAFIVFPPLAIVLFIEYLENPMRSVLVDPAVIFLIYKGTAAACVAIYSQIAPVTPAEVVSLLPSRIRPIYFDEF